MKKLSLRAITRHLEQLIVAVPGIDGLFENTNETASFVNKLRRLLDLVLESDTAEPGLKGLREALFPGAKEDSRRVLFSNFRKTLSLAASNSGKNFTLQQPNLRGKLLEEVVCWFEGDGFPDERERITNAAAEKLDELTQAESRLVPDVIRVFISFANADREKVNLLKEALISTWGHSRSHQVEFWTFNDPKGGGILAGECNLEQIEGAIAGAPLGLFLLSPSFSQSKFIEKHELPPYFPPTGGKHPVFVNLRNSRPPALHLRPEIAKGNIFSFQEKSFDEMRGKGPQEQFASALNDQIELLCKKYYSISNTSSAPPRSSKRPPLLHRERHALIPPEEDAECRLVDPAYHRGDQGIDAVTDLLAWAKDGNRGHYFALLGETGSGKTTTILMFARRLNAAKGKVRAYLFDLRYANYDGLLERTANRPTLKEIMTAVLRRGDAGDITAGDYLTAVREEQAILIFDGLDEVFVALNSSEQDSLMKEILSALPLGTAKKDGAGKLLLACRTQYYRSPQAERGGLTLQGREGWDLENTTSARTNIELARVLPFSESQIRAYFEANLASIPFETIWQTLEEIHELTELATRPYLLNLIRRQIPSLNAKLERNEAVRAIDLYRGFVDDWSHERNKFHNIILPEDKNDLMEWLAAHMWRRGAKTLLAADLERWLLDTLVTHPRWRTIYADHLKPKAQESLLSDFRTASFIARWDGDAFRFAHTSLQEYFLACHLARSLYIQGGYPKEAWDVPMPSWETFDFIGQALQSVGIRDQETATEQLRGLLGDSANSVAARTAALRYFSLSLSQRFPIPERPDLAMQGVDITAWEIDARNLGPVSLGAVDFTGATLIRTRIEGVVFPKGSIWRGADLRGSKWADCELFGADFSGTNVDGAWFRKCDLKETKANGVNTSQASNHLSSLSDDSPWVWRQAPPSAYLSLQLGHSDAVSSVAYSPDGRWFASGGEDGSIRLFGADTRACVRCWRNGDGGIRSIKFSPDSRFLASAHDLGLVSLWDVGSGRLEREFNGRLDDLRCISFSVDGNQIVSGCCSGYVNLWETRSGELLGKFDLGSPINSAVLSHDSRRVIATDIQGYWIDYEISTDQKTTVLPATPDGFYVSAIASNRGTVFFGNSNGDIICWNADNGIIARVERAHGQPVNSIAISSDRQKIATGSDDGTIRVWSADLQTCIATMKGHLSWVTSVDFSPCGKKIVSGSSDYNVTVWEAETGILLQAIVGTFTMVSSVELSPSGGGIWAVDIDDRPLYWNLEGIPGKYSPAGTSDSDRSAPADPALDVEEVSHSTIRLRQNNRLLRDIIPLPDGKALVLEPWDEAESLKPPHECRWKLVCGPADAWRYAVAVDPETLDVHPPEYATENGTWEII